MTKLISVVLAGSRAYGIHNENSDVDLRGVFSVSRERRLSLFPHTDVIDKKEPDITLYDIAKFMRLAMKNNPNYLELLYSPQYLWRYSTEAWVYLVSRRNAFLNASVVNSYIGAATQHYRTALRDYNTTGSFTTKHLVHAYRYAVGIIYIIKYHVVPVDYISLLPEQTHIMREMRAGNIPDEDMFTIVQDALNLVRNAEHFHMMPRESSKSYIDKIYRELLDIVDEMDEPKKGEVFNELLKGVE